MRGAFLLVQVIFAVLVAVAYSDLGVLPDEQGDQKIVQENQEDKAVQESFPLQQKTCWMIF